MPTGVDPNWRETLETLMHRNGAVEITSVATDDSLTPTYRVRLLDVRDDALVVERPHQPEVGHYFKYGSQVCILAIDGDKRWEMLTMVTDMAGFQLNESTRVGAITLSMPRDGRSAQRRRYFRVSTAASRLWPVVMTPLVEEAPPISPVGGEPQAAAPGSQLDPDAPLAYFAKLVNIGGGGLGVEAPQRVASQLVDVIRYRCRLDLPTLDTPLELNARVVHLAPLEGGTHYLGLCFEFTDRLQRLQSEDLICKFTAWHQRQELQRQRNG